MLRSRAYLHFVIEHPCLGCGAKAEHAHHFGKSRGGGGIGLKPHDTFTVPLCADCHATVHRNGTLPRPFGSVRLCGDELAGYFAVTALRLVTEWLEKRKR